MAYELFIGLRYLRAKRKQTFISVNSIISMVGIFLGVAALIVVLAVMNGFETNLREKILGINSHIVLMEYHGGMKDYTQVAERVETVPGVVASTPFIYGQAMVKNRGRVTGVVIRGISLDTVFTVITFGTTVAGRIDDLAVAADEDDGDARPGIVVGTELAENLGMRVDDIIEVVSPLGVSTPMGPVPRIKKFRVVGVFDSGFYEYDSSLVFMNLADAQQFLNMRDIVTGLEIKVDNVYHAKEIAHAIEDELGTPYWARNWMEMNRNLFSALKLEKVVMFIILCLIVLVAAFNIITTLIMSVMEKNKDIAILKSMGASSRSIMTIFMIQGLIIGVVGTITGCIAGLSIALNLERLTAWIERTFGLTILPKDVYYLNELPSKVNDGDVVIIVIVTMVLCFFASIYPAWSASKLDPAEALRYE